jgi:hypothetical protein
MYLRIPTSLDLLAIGILAHHSAYVILHRLAKGLPPLGNRRFDQATGRPVGECRDLKMALLLPLCALGWQPA